MGNNLLFFKLSGLQDWEGSILASEGPSTVQIQGYWVLGFRDFGGVGVGAWGFRARNKQCHTSRIWGASNIAREQPPKASKLRDRGSQQQHWKSATPCLEHIGWEHTSGTQPLPSSVEGQLHFCSPPHLSDYQTLSSRHRRGSLRQPLGRCGSRLPSSPLGLPWSATECPKPRDMWDQIGGYVGAFMIVMMGILELFPGPSGLYKVYHTDCEGNAGHRILGV